MSKCGKNCRRGCGFSGEVTFGTGLKDPYGYWQFPCRECAAEFDARNEEIKDEIRRELLDKGLFPLQVAEYLADQTWLRQPAWPRADQDVAKLIEDNKEYYAQLEGTAKC